MDIECSLYVSPNCQGTLLEPGGLTFTPPDNEGFVLKEHVCKECWTALRIEILIMREHAK